MMGFIGVSTVISILLQINSVMGHEVEVGPCLVQYLEPCSSDRIQFYMYSSDFPNRTSEGLSALAPHIPDWVDLAKPIKLIMHGYAGHVDFNWTKEIAEAYLEAQNVTVIIVDWGKLANMPCYPSAAFNTKQAGECTANFLVELELLQRGFNLSHVHAIGFSLGAHAVSFTSNALERMVKRKLARITALDPALPFFSTQSLDWKLDSTDADFVDVIHTNAGIFGKLEACGHIDFYVNGGQYQKACDHHKNKPLCSHLLSTNYFVESIMNSERFFGVKCESYFLFVFGFCSDEVEDKMKVPKVEMMGEYCPMNAQGIYFVATNNEAPFAMGMNQTASKNAPTSVKP